jgi:hypothetical protein
LEHSAAKSLATFATVVRIDPCVGEEPEAGEELDGEVECSASKIPFTDSRRGPKCGFQHQPQAFRPWPLKKKKKGLSLRRTSYESAVWYCIVPNRLLPNGDGLLEDVPLFTTPV